MTLAPFCRRVFEADAMAACAAKGHAWRWVTTWHAVGRRECWRCGWTGPTARMVRLSEHSSMVHGDDLGVRTDADAIKGFAPELVATVQQDIDRADAAAKADPDALTVVGLVGEYEPRGRGRPAGSRSTRPSPLCQVARNEEIRRRRAAGERPSALAREYGVTQARIAQLCKGITPQIGG